MIRKDAGIPFPGWDPSISSMIAQVTMREEPEIGIVYRLAPRRLVAAVMGGFYALTLGLGGYAAGWLGQFAVTLGNAPFFAGLSVVMIGAAVAALLLRKTLMRVAAIYGADLSSATV